MTRWYVVRLRDAVRGAAMMRLVQATTGAEAVLACMDRGARQWAEIEVLELRQWASAATFDVAPSERESVEPWAGSGTTAPS